MSIKEDNLDKQIVKYGRIIFNEEFLSSYLSVGISHSHLKFCKKIPVDVNFFHVFVGIELEGGLFDKYSYVNTKSQSDVVEMTNAWSNANTVETASEAGINIKLNKEAEIGGSTKDARKSTKQNASSEEYKRTLPDLRITLNNECEKFPEWLIFQINKSPLVLDPGECIKMATLARPPEPESINLSGSIWTDRNGYEVKSGNLNIFESANLSLRVKLALFKQKLKIKIEEKKPLDVVAM